MKLRLARKIRTAHDLDEFAFPTSPSGAWFWPSWQPQSKTDNRPYRELLWRIWDNKLPKMVFIMLNPSTADGLDDDATIRRCIYFAKRERCGGFYVINLWTRRATNPNTLNLHHWHCNNSPQSGRYMVRAFLQARQHDWPVVVGWGSHKAAKYRRGYVADLALGYGIALNCFEINKDGNPKHPLYVKGDKPLIPWPAGADWR